MKYQAMLDLYMPSIEVELLRHLKDYGYKLDETSLRSKGRHLIVNNNTYTFKINLQELIRDILYTTSGDVDVQMNDVEYGLFKIAQMVYQRIDILNMTKESIHKMEVLASIYGIKVVKNAEGSIEIC